MTSAINPDFPLAGNPTTESVRNNFQIAHDEISLLQAQLASLLLNMPYLPLAGATMTGSLRLAGDPTNDNEASTKAYVDALKALIDALEARVAALEPPSP